MVPESLNEVDEKELRLIEFKPEDGRESVVRVFREEFEENRRAEGGVRRCLALSARLKRGRSIQMDAEEGTPPLWEGGSPDLVPWEVLPSGESLLRRGGAISCHGSGQQLRKHNIDVRARWIGRSFYSPDIPQTDVVRIARLEPLNSIAL